MADHCSILMLCAGEQTRGDNCLCPSPHEPKNRLPATENVLLFHNMSSYCARLGALSAIRNRFSLHFRSPLISAIRVFDAGDLPSLASLVKILVPAQIPHLMITVA